MNRLWWVSKGDLNAFFVLILDNVTQFVIFSSLLIGLFGFPKDIVFKYMIPGTALGILVGNIMFTYLAVQLGRKEGRKDVTSMPLGIDTVSLFGYTFAIIGPVWLATGDAVFSWHVAAATIVLTGIIKILFSWGSGWIKSVFPRASLLGSIAGVALMLIAFLPSQILFNSPVVGFVSLGLIFMTLFTKRKTVWGLPGVLWAVMVATGMFYLFKFAAPDMVNVHQISEVYPGLHFPLPLIGSMESYIKAFSFISIILPLSIVNVVGGIDVTESAIAAGDKYDTRKIIFTEGITTLVGGLFGGVLQTTPYIGHPAYKKMDARAGYTLATGLFIGIGGFFGILGMISNFLPQEAVVPILMFIGLELSYQAFRTVPERHAHVVALCFLPSIANLVLIELGQFGVDLDGLKEGMVSKFEAIKLFANGFVITAMIWGAAFANLIDEKPKRLAAFLLAGSLFSLVGLMHSPLEQGALFLPWHIDTTVPFQFALGYGILALLALVLWLRGDRAKPG